MRKLTPPAEAKSKPEPEPTGLERELVERGVTRAVAADLVRDFPEDRIQAQIERADWLREAKPKRIKDLGAYLAEAIREDYAAPAGFEGKAGAGPGDGPRATLEREVESRRTKAREQEERDRVQAYREALPPERRAARRRGVAGPPPPTARRTRRRRHRRSRGCSWPASATP